MKKIAIVLIAAFINTACTTITFESKDANISNKVSKKEKWHHNVAFGLVEVSAPVNLKQECEGHGWTSVTTESSFSNIVLSQISNAIMRPLTINSYGVWTPKTVTVTCVTEDSDSQKHARFVLKKLIWQSSLL